MYKVKSPSRCVFKSRASAQSRAAVNTNFHTWINSPGWLCSGRGSTRTPGGGRAAGGGELLLMIPWLSASSHSPSFL